jgi:hypothetical protein
MPKSVLAEESMTAAAFLRTVLNLWGDHWIQPCQGVDSQKVAVALGSR